MTNKPRTGIRANPFLVMAGLYLTVGLLAVAGRLAVDVGVVAPLPRLRWTTIHLVTIGGMTQALFGALPHLVGSVGGSTDRLSPGIRWLQWLSLNGGYVLVLYGMTTGSTVVTVAGATVVLVALALLMASVYRVSARSNASHLIDYYRVAPWFLVVGILAALGMLTNVHGPGGYFGSIEAHVHANVWGFLALVVAGTLLHAVPRLAGTDLRYPRLVGVTLWGTTVGAVGLVSGPWLAVNALTVVGLAVYVVGTVALLANVVGTARAAGRLRDARVGHVLGAYVWLVFPVPWAPLVLLFPDAVPAAAIERVAIEGLVFGWMLQLAMAMLPAVASAFDDAEGAFVDVTRTVDEAAGTASWAGVVAVNVGMLFVWTTALPGLGDLADPLGTVGFALVALAWAGFLPRLWRTLVGGASRTRPGEPTDSSPSTGD